MPLMNHEDLVIDALEARSRRRHDRRALFTAALGVAAVGSAFAYSDPARAQAAVTDADVLNFALNLEYLEAQFYLYAVNGTGLPASLTGSGSTAGGTVTGGAKVDFSGDPNVGAYAREIAADEQAHVNFLRTALGASAVAMPNINISGAADGPFTAAARAAGVVGASDTFNPYADPTSFLLGAFIFEDVGVTAYKGAAPLLTNKTFLEAAAGILAVEAYHAAIVRTTLYAKGVPALIQATEQISAARDALDGSPTEDQVRGIAPDDDQGIAPSGSGATLTANIAPLNANGLAYSRTTGQVLNIVYLNAATTTMGGFFPNGVNGNIRSTA
ncbi:ferritin-like protein [Sphingomonas sp. BK235]|jgi:hypothetical protein|nr:ferritin-like protein [Sphingomonas sp. BK235]